MAQVELIALPVVGFDPAAASVYEAADSRSFSRPRQDMRGEGGFRTVALVDEAPLRGTLTLRLTGAERQVFQDTMMDRFAAGEVLKVYGQFFVLEGESVTVDYRPMFEGQSTWYTVSFDVEVL